MRNEDVGDLASADFISEQLHLGALATVDEVVVSIVGDDLTGGMAIECRNRRVIAKNGEC